MQTITLYSRQDCHLCEEVKAHLAALQAQFPHTLTEIDIDTDPSLREKYGTSVPVLKVGPYTKHAPITRQDLEVTLAAARDRASQLDTLADPKHARAQERARAISRGDRFSFWLSKHYLLALNAIILLYVGLPFVAPVFMKIGWTIPATGIYRAYSLVCHNLGYRSWFLFGGQAAYPRAAANVEGLETFGAATGLSEGNTNAEIFAARRYLGDEQVGYKVAFCQRDVAIYAGIFLFGLLYALSKTRIPPLHWLAWVIIGGGPIALDGFSQLFSQMDFPLLDFLAYRESTPLLRTLTGGLFGFLTAWFGYPLVKESMDDTRRSLLVKFKRLGIEPPG
jgi:uncharacterized membrane protein/glutaredoxin